MRQFNFNDERTLIVLILGIIAWTLIAVLTSVYIYRQVFVIPLREAVRLENPDSSLDISMLDELERSVVREVYEIAKLREEERASIWDTIITSLNETEAVTSVLDGMKIFNATVDKNIASVMIENSPEVSDRQYGLQDAFHVWNMPTEGGITRYLAFYRMDALPSRIGPVRSVRPYFLEVARGFTNIPLVHIGGSPQALQLLPTLPIEDIDEDERNVIDRDMNYYAPHNAYVETETLSSLFKKNEWSVSIPSSFLEFTDEITIPDTPSKVQISTRLTPDINYEWSSDAFVRMQDGVQTMDYETGEPVTINNVVVLYADMTNVPNDDQGRIEISFTSGKAVYLIGNTVIEGEYGYDSSEKVFTFTRNSERMTFAKGNTWFEVVPQDAVVNVINSL